VKCYARIYTTDKRYTIDYGHLFAAPTCGNKIEKRKPDNAIIRGSERRFRRRAHGTSRAICVGNLPVAHVGNKLVPDRATSVHESNAKCSVIGNAGTVRESFLAGKAI
jgi:hypothetical protein